MSFFTVSVGITKHTDLSADGVTKINFVRVLSVNLKQ